MQKVVRTYPEGYPQTTGRLNSYLSSGWKIVACHVFELAGEGSLLGCIMHGNEYIIEKIGEKDERATS